MEMRIERSDNAAARFFKKAASESIKLILAAMAFLASLAWNDAIKEFIDSREELKASGPWVYASCITVLAVAFAVLLGGFILPGKGCR